MVKHDQEMHMTGNVQKEHELKFRRRNSDINRATKVPEAHEIDQSPDDLTRSSQLEHLK